MTLILVKYFYKVQSKDSMELFIYFETKGRQVSAKAQEVVDHLASFMLGIEER